MVDRLIDFFDIGNLESWFFRLLPAILVLLGTILCSRLLQGLLRKRYKKHNNKDEKTLGSYIRFIRASLTLVGAGLVLHVLGINMTSIFTAGGVVAVAFAFAMKNLSENLISGLIIQMEGAIKKGDILETEGRLVMVEQIGIRATTARTKAEQNIIIPNAELIRNPIVNYTFRDSLYRLETRIDIGYKENQENVFLAIKQVCGSLEWSSSIKEPVIHLHRFGDSGIRYYIYVWIENPWDGEQLSSELNRGIYLALTNACISMSYPQLDVHLDESS